MVATRWYPKAFAYTANGEVDWADETTLKVAVMNDPFAFNDAHDTWADVAASDYSSSTGYTAGGEVITTPTVTEIDSAALDARANTTAYLKGDLVRTASDSGRVFICVTAGTSAGSEPGGMATLASGVNITDGTVVWLNVGSALTAFGGDAVSWTGLDTDPTNAAVIYNDDGANEPLVGYVDFETTLNPTGIQLTPPASGYLWIAGGGGI